MSDGHLQAGGGPCKASGYMKGVEEGGQVCKHGEGAHSQCEHGGGWGAAASVYTRRGTKTKYACKARRYRAYAHMEDGTENIHRGSWSVLRKILRLSQGF